MRTTSAGRKDRWACSTLSEQGGHHRLQTRTLSTAALPDTIAIQLAATDLALTSWNPLNSWQDTRQAGPPEHIGTKSDINHPFHPKAINDLAGKEEERRLHGEQNPPE